MNDELVKVCGMRDADNIRAVEQLGVDWMGFIFWPQSSRYVSHVPSYLPTRAKRVGVFVDATVEDVVRHVADYGLDLVQLHGHETPGYIRTLRSLLDSVTSDDTCNMGFVCGNRVATPSLIKALSIADRDDIMAYHPYEGIVDYFLFDTKCKSMGGSGLQFDWTVLSAYDGTTPFLLSGGIGPDDADRLHDFLSPDSNPVASRCVGVDLNSRFELSPALKDTQALAAFLPQLSFKPHNTLSRL